MRQNYLLTWGDEEVTNEYDLAYTPTITAKDLLAFENAKVRVSTWILD